MKEALKMALEALEKVTIEMLACRDELAERGGRPTSNVFYQRLWDSSFDVYTNHAMPAAEAIKQALAQPAQQERNFCPRCGKRTADLTVIHTCTPPQENT